MAEGFEKNGRLWKVEQRWLTSYLAVALVISAD